MSFDAAQPGTSESAWLADTRLHDRPLLALGEVDELIVIGAHPDDETLGAGGLIARCAGAGVPVRVVCVTDGAASHPDDLGITRSREEELAAAVGELAPRATVEMLGFPDGKTREHRSDIEKALGAALGEASPKAVVAAPWRGDGHRDHRVVGEIAAELAGRRLLLEYPIWMWHWARPEAAETPWERMVAVDIDPEAKRRAIRRFPSQTSGDPPLLRSDFLDHFAREQEVFITGDRALGRDYFDDIYDRSEDPWRFRTRWYEQRKRRITLAALPHERYRRGLEIGCSIGMLTDLLSSRCDRLLAVDISERAVERARAFLGTRATVRRCDVLEDFPDGEFDLVVLSEVGYYWGAAGLRRALDDIDRHLAPSGIVVACHWRHPVADYPMTGDEVHAAIAQRSWKRVLHHLEDDFILEVFSVDPRSVAQQEGFA